MSLANLLEWWNFLFALPLVVGIVLSAGALLTSVGESAGDGEGSADEGEAETEPAGTETKSLTKSHHDDPTTFFGKVLQLFGIGMGVPLTVLLPVLMIFWGAIGLTTNSLLQPLLKAPALFVPISVMVSLVGMALIGRTTGLLVRRFHLLGEAHVPSRYDLIGCVGHAVFPIDSQQGTANIHARSGDIVRVSCRTLPGQPPIPAGTPVLVAQYNERTNDYIVEPNPFGVDLSEPILQENPATEQNRLRG
ncbi:MAG: hypothetical protein SNJ72_03470 [Fimbriimonadales bacterium]